MNFKLPQPVMGLADTAAPADADAFRTLPVQFTGTGREYFRIWLVNTLLTVLTLTLYFPFAKARRLRWMHANTQVDGHALGFHGNPWKMLRGYLWLAAFAGTYLVADHFRSPARIAALLVLAALWPALWRSALRFRLANTSWRGMRMRFTGTTGEAYRALLPALVPVVLALAFSQWMSLKGTSPGTAPPPRLGSGAWPDWRALGLVAVGPVLITALLPWLLARAKRYQHSHYRWANQATRFDARLRDFYAIWLRVGLIALIPFVGMVVLVARKLPTVYGPQGRVTLMILVGLGLLAYAAVMLAGRAYLVARLQDLVWSNTHTGSIRFSSDLHASDLAHRLLINLLFSALTLGLYWPFGQVQLARLRLQAMRVTVTATAAAWAAPAEVGTPEATGDAAGDLLGLDLGW